jgi:hypothetical protein
MKPGVPFISTGLHTSKAFNTHQRTMLIIEKGQSIVENEHDYTQQDYHLQQHHVHNVK